ncbi:unnamed protein product [Timema podura]|uniref:Uncharacterized protein n=1 Tax=Timema podura TaxID=61482 RepID=A0ABN7NRS5_TIMPD|nr:unnamed protein product [Timema podura]
MNTGTEENEILVCASEYIKGMKAVGRNAKSVYEVWKLFFPDIVIEEITIHANDSLRIMREN